MSVNTVAPRCDDPHCNKSLAIGRVLRGHLIKFIADYMGSRLSRTLIIKINEQDFEGWVLGVHYS